MTISSQPINCVFLGTSSFAVPTLRALAQATEASVAAVYTQPDQPAGRGRRPRPSPVKEAAEELGLPVVQPERLRAPEEVDRLRSFEPAVLILAAYGQILPARILEVPPHGGLNVHPSLLPRHRGPSPVATAILEGDEVTGVSIFSMDAGMDSGPVLARRQIAIGPGETAETLTDRLAEDGAHLLMEVIEPWVDGSLSAEPQDPSEATTTRLLSRDDAVLDFSQPAGALAHRVRALDPWPGTATTLGGQKFNIRAARASESETPPGAQGEVVALAGGGTGVIVGNGTVLVLDRVQIAGKRAVNADEFARGRRDFVGTVLPS
jgi:methionyl-tRNA formyltransferase